MARRGGGGVGSTRLSEVPEHLQSPEALENKHATAIVSRTFEPSLLYPSLQSRPHLSYAQLYVHYTLSSPCSPALRHIWASATSTADFSLLPLRMHHPLKSPPPAYPRTLLPALPLRQVLHHPNTQFLPTVRKRKCQLLM